MHLLNLNTVGYTHINKVWCVALGNLVIVWRDRKKAVFKSCPMVWKSWGGKDGF